MSKFTGANCEQLRSSATPSILGEEFEVCLTGGRCVSPLPLDGNVYVGDPTFENRPGTVKYQWHHQFQPFAQGEQAPTLPVYAYTPGRSGSYISNFNVGISSAIVDVVSPAGGTVQYGWGGLQAPTRSNPHLAVRDMTADASFGTMTDGLRFVGDLKVQPGGTVTVHGTRRNIISPAETVQRFQAVFDFTPPYSTNPANCLQAPELLSTTNQADLVIGSFTDAHSPITTIRVETCRMFLRDDSLHIDPNTCRNLRTTFGMNARPTAPRTHSVALPSAGLWAHVVDVYDATGENFRLARRFTLYDGAPTVTVSARNDLLVTSAGNAGRLPTTAQRLWQTQSNSITAAWTGRYSTSNRDYLWPIEDQEHVEAAYDEPAGGELSKAGRPNRRGVTSFAWRVTPVRAAASGGFGWTTGQGPLRLQETATANGLGLQNGETYRVEVRARGIFAAETQIDSVEISIDTTIPEIDFHGLTRNGETNLAFHSEEDLTSMDIGFRAFDADSSLRTVHWEIFANGDDDQVQGDALVGASLPVQRCARNTADCVCPVTGDCASRLFDIPLHNYPVLIDGVHARGYTFRVEVTNRAGLSHTESYTLTIDTTPPVGGFAQVGEPGQPEINYQAERVVHANWGGFSDPESGIMHYRVAFATSCLSAVSAAFSAPIPPTRRFAQNTVARDGEYFVNVVAYNHALEQSSMRCSNPVIVDSAAPAMRNAFLTNGAAKPGYANDAAGTLWLVHPNMTRSQLSAGAGCPLSAPATLDLRVFRVLPGQVDRQSVCWSLQRLDRVELHQYSNTAVAAEWSSITPVEFIREYAVGLSSAAGGSANLRAFASTGQRNSTMILKNGITGVFFLQIRIVKLTGLSSVFEIGPIYTDSTPPGSGGITTPTITNAGVSFSWSAFPDEQATAVRYEVALGTNASQPDVLPYLLRNDLDTCNRNDNLCASIAADAIPHGPLFLLVRGCNLALLCTVVSRAVTVRPRMLTPVAGQVLDIGPGSTASGSEVDFQTSTTNLKVRWNAFEGTDVQYEVAVGTSIGGTNILGWRSGGVNQAGTFASVNQVLVLGNTYFVSVRATNALGSAVATSDGVQVVLDTGLYRMEVSDGVGCDGQPNLLDAPVSGSASGANPMTLYAILQVGHTYTLTGAGSGAILVDAGSRTAAVSSPVTFVATTTNSSIRIYTAGAGVAITSIVVQECQTDVAVQRSTEQVSASWSALVNSVGMVATYKQHAVEAQQGDGSWSLVRGYVTVPHGATSSTVPMPSLASGQTYRSAIRGCNPLGCFTGATSDGVTVLPGVPVTSNFANVTYGHPLGHDGTTELLISFEPATANVEMYQWALTEDAFASGAFTPWYTVVRPAMSSAAGDQQEPNTTVHWQVAPSILIQIDATLGLDLSLHDAHGPVYLLLRGFTPDGSSSTIATQAVPTSRLAPHLRVAIRDGVSALGPDQGDVDYTGQNGEIYATWPSLWPLVHPDYYTWSISTERSFVESCNGTTAICGRTRGPETHGFVTQLDLEHGERYFFCVKAGTTTVETDSSVVVQDAPDATSCSNGITVDLTPPTAGVVQMGNPAAHVAAAESVFQHSKEELTVRWSGFVDVEEYEDSPHHSGIAKYMLSIGSSVGASDVLGPADTGSSNHFIARNLALSDGHSYYATVTAVDFAGLNATAVSAPVVVDSTPPVAGDIQIHDIVSSEPGSVAITVGWSDFTDPDTEIVSYLVGAGSSVDMSDIQAPASCDRLDVCVVSLSGVSDGQPLVLSVTAINRAGLRTTQFTHAMLLDTQPPAVGHVLDSATGDDIAYSSSSDTLGASWVGFLDLSGIHEYWWGVGLTPGATDVRGYARLPGTATEATTTALQLVDGTTYYATVQACDRQDRCSEASSDGVVVDSSAPVAGNVNDGFGVFDADYQVDDHVISASWNSFHDPHSPIVKYTWCVGMAAGQCDLQEHVSVGLNTRALNTELQLSDASGNAIGRVYVTVTAYNAAGLTVSQSSDGIQADDRAPEVASDGAPRLIPVFPIPGATNARSQPARTVLRAEWGFVNQRPETSLTYTYSIRGTDGTDSPVPEPIVGGANGALLANVDLRDGIIYRLTVYACDVANLCATEVDSSSGLLVDGSAPVPGQWVGDDMRFNDNTISLHWTACEDPHSSVTSYRAAVGSRYGLADIATGNGDGNWGTGGTLTHNRAITPGQVYYAMVTCANEAGVEADPVHLSMTAMADGQLLVQATGCDSVDCDGRCTCGDPLCAPLPATQCVNRNRAPLNLVIHDGVGDTDAALQSEQTVLRAHWNGAQTQGLRLQFTAGLNNGVPGSTLANAGPLLWRDLYPGASSAVFETGHNADTCTGCTGTLQADSTYVVSLKVWHNANQYSIYTTNGVMIDPSAPQQSRRGARVRVVDATGNETDQLDSANIVRIGWGTSAQGYTVFQDTSSGISAYEYALGTAPMASNTEDWAPAGSSTEATLTGLSLRHGQEYWASVRATNGAGLYSVGTTNPMTLDTTAPAAGVVRDGTGVEDPTFQSDPSSLGAHWFGFADMESGVAGYQVAIGTSAGATDILSFRTVGLNTSGSWPGNYGAGTYFVSVKAKNPASQWSQAVSSTGVTIDTTPAISAQCTNGASIVSGGSFESAADRSSWSFTGAAATVTSLSPTLGTQAVALTGDADGVSQTLRTAVGSTYHVTLSSRLQSSSAIRDDSIGISAILGEVRAGEELYSFQNAERPGATWTTHGFHFTATSTSSVLTFASSTLSEMAPTLIIDGVAVTVCSNAGTDATTAVSVGPRFQSNGHEVHAQWLVNDEESGIIGARWAIGTVPGGEQLQRYRSVGHVTHAYNTHLELPHNVSVYVSVAVENGAGMVTVFGSPAVLIDSTPPHIGTLHHADQFHSTDGSITVSWPELSDPESGIAGCTAAMGVTPGAGRFEPVIGLSHAFTIPEGQFGDRFVTLRCSNGAGLTSEAVSSGLTVVAPASSSAATVTIVPHPGEWVYESESGFQSVQDQITASWDGFSTSGEVSEYEVRLTGPGVGTPTWQSTGLRQRVSLTGLALNHSGAYRVDVRARDSLGRTTSAVNNTVSIDATAPVLGSAPVCGAFSTADGSTTVTVSWPELFSEDSSGSIRYEVSAGRSSGSTEFLRRDVTTLTTRSVSLPAGLQTVYITVTAVNAAGLSTSAWKAIDLPGSGSSSVCAQ